MLLALDARDRCWKKVKIEIMLLVVAAAARRQTVAKNECTYIYVYIFQTHIKIRSRFHLWATWRMWKASLKNDQLARQNETRMLYILRRDILRLIFFLFQKLSVTTTSDSFNLDIGVPTRVAICTYIHPVSSICFSSAICHVKCEKII